MHTVHLYNGQNKTGCDKLLLRLTKERKRKEEGLSRPLDIIESNLQ